MLSECKLRGAAPVDAIFGWGISFLFPQQVTGCIYMFRLLLRGESGDADNYGKKAARTVQEAA
jgi:hypothetical protein